MRHEVKITCKQLYSDVLTEASHELADATAVYCFQGWRKIVEGPGSHRPWRKDGAVQVPCQQLQEWQPEGHVSGVLLEEQNCGALPPCGSAPAHWVQVPRMQLCPIFGSQIHILYLQQHDIMPALVCSVQLHASRALAQLICRQPSGLHLHASQCYDGLSQLSRAMQEGGHGTCLIVEVKIMRRVLVVARYARYLRDIYLQIYQEQNSGHSLNLGIETLST